MIGKKIVKLTVLATVVFGSADYEQLFDKETHDTTVRFDNLAATMRIDDITTVKSPFSTSIDHANFQFDLRAGRYCTYFENKGWPLLNCNFQKSTDAKDYQFGVLSNEQKDQIKVFVARHTQNTSPGL